MITTSPLQVTLAVEVIETSPLPLLFIKLTLAMVQVAVTVAEASLTSPPLPKALKP